MNAMSLLTPLLLSKVTPLDKELLGQQQEHNKQQCLKKITTLLPLKND